MEWDTFVGHSTQRAWFENALARNRVASTFLLVGQEGIGKRTFAKLIAKSLLCTGSDARKLDLCNRCETCKQVDAGTHPDVIEIAPEKDKSRITMRQLVGEDENRLREGLCYEIRFHPYSGRRKFAIIDYADTLERHTANALLKTLEEPPLGAVIFLIGTSEKRQISTIRSRSQIVRFSPLTEEELVRVVQGEGIATTVDEARRIASYSHGSVSQAKEVSDPSMLEFIEQLLGFFRQKPFDFVQLSQVILKHIKENLEDDSGQAKRERLRWILDQVSELLRLAIRHQLGVSTGTDAGFARAGRAIATVDQTALIALVALTQEAREKVFRNVNQSAIVEWWTSKFASVGGL